MAHSGRIGDAARLRGGVTRGLPALRCRISGPDDLARREWLVTNGIGGYASGTVRGAPSRRYHGLLVSAFPNPLGRMIMLSALDENLPEESIAEFVLDAGIPTWRYHVEGARIEKRVVMPHRQNTTVIEYRLVEGAAFALRLTAVVDFRSYEESVSEAVREDYRFSQSDEEFILESAGIPPLRLLLHGDFDFALDAARRDRVLYAMEEARGYRGHGVLWSPGVFTVRLQPGVPSYFVASTEVPEVRDALTPPEAFSTEITRKARLMEVAPGPAREGPGAHLVIAADQFVITPVGRQRDSARAAASGAELRTVVAGYHWFTDWGRDTMISLEGLTLTTGRFREAAFILRTFAHYVRDGLIPNLFPNGSDAGLYHTADATLWFFHALDRYTRVTGDESVLLDVLPVVRAIIEAHLRGTRFGIGVDGDGLLRQGAEGYQLTWMDAKVDGWVVTPRRGKAVEINALWYNALCLLSSWESRLGAAERGRALADAAGLARRSFNERFWFEKGGHLYDVVDGPEGDDAACRPNQIFAIALPNPVLDEARWRPVLQVVETQLLTPVGLRSLSPQHPDYRRTYAGDLRSRDAAYHQGTVWGWLIGPWVDAWLRAHPEDREGARRFLDGLIAHLTEFGVGSIAEIFDAEPPFTPRGCIAQAWSVAEALRCWARTSAADPSSWPSPAP